MKRKLLPIIDRTIAALQKLRAWCLRTNKSPDREPTKYVLANSYVSFIDYCREWNLNPHHKEAVRKVNDFYSIAGVRGGILVVLKGAEKRSDCKEIIERWIKLNGDFSVVFQDHNAIYA